MAEIYYLLCLTVIAVVFNSVTAIDYCNLESCEKDTHTLCKYSSTSTAVACGRVYKLGLTYDEKKAILDKHNELRQKVASGEEIRGQPGPQPAAVCMPNLTWDYELEITAQSWANQCNYNYDTCRNVDRFTVGQNIVEIYSPKKVYSLKENLLHLLKMIELTWYSQVTKFDKNNISSYKYDLNTVHYTQLIWADTTKIGCGLIRCTNKKSITRSSENIIGYLVCNYGPSGNLIGKEIYKVKNYV